MDASGDLGDDLRRQADFIAPREPAYARLLQQFDAASAGAFGARLDRLWAARAFRAWYERPLLLLAALRYDALTEGPLHPLFEVLVANPGDAALLDVADFDAAIARPRFEDALHTRSVQTNETTRAVAWLWPAALLCRFGARRPLGLVDLGASAGLNLVADALPSIWTGDDDQPLPVEPRPGVAVRLGLDAAPLDATREDDARWLRACVWPSDHGRLARLDDAIAAFRAASRRPDAPRLAACALGDAPARLAALSGEVTVLGIQTIVRDYVSAAELERYTTGLRAFLLGRAPGTAFIVQLELDATGDPGPERLAALAITGANAHGRLATFTLARTHPHPRRVFVDSRAVASFEDLVRQSLA